jgi:hypothetical protein
MVSRVVSSNLRNDGAFFIQWNSVDFPIGFSQLQPEFRFNHVSLPQGIDKSLEDKFDSVQQFVELGSVRKFHIFFCKVDEFDKGQNLTVLHVIWLS